MKFMRLGCKPDVFEYHGSTRSVVSEIPCDFTVVTDGVTFRLHKFPLLSKSTRLQKLASKAAQEGSIIVELLDFPGDAATFELCVKFCYGITITLNAYNVVAVRCACDYLGMSEAAEKGNLMFKVEVFLNSYIFYGWKDSIVALKSIRALLPWADQLQLTTACVDAIASKVFANLSKVDWSYTYTRGHEITGSPVKRRQLAHVDWWIEDIAELEIDLYCRVFAAINSKRRMPTKLLGVALQFYAAKWLVALGNDHVLKKTDEQVSKDRQLFEIIVGLLPPDKGCAPCGFLLKLVKAGVILGTSLSSRKELTRRAGFQLDEACVKDLLIPSLPQSSGFLFYDIELVYTMVEHFMAQDQSPPTSPVRTRRPPERRRTRSAEHVHFVESRRSTTVTHAAKLRVGKLIDGYLSEIAKDPQLDISKFMALARLIPDFARPSHDGLYKAIDIYLKEHSDLPKSERKRICGLLDCKKLSMEACMEAAQNEQLPVRVVVQVLFFEQVRASMAGGVSLAELPHRVKALMSIQEGESLETKHMGNGQWEKVGASSNESTRVKIEGAGKEHIDAVLDDMKSSATSVKTKKFFSKVLPRKGLPESTMSCCPQLMAKEHDSGRKKLLAR